MNANGLLRPIFDETGQPALQRLASNRIARYFGISPQLAEDIAAAVLDENRKYWADASLPNSAGKGGAET